MLTAINNDNQISIKNNIIAPSISDTFWSPESLWDTGFLDSYKDSLGTIAIERYPDNNCAAAFPSPQTADQIVDPQERFPKYLNHKDYIIDTLAPYLNTANIAQGLGKPFMMFETNTASCGGFLGISDSFGAALWILDWGLQMAYSNFTGSLLHVGGVSDVYNVRLFNFTPIATVHV